MTKESQQPIILIVDDQPDNARLLVRVLSREGYRVLVVDNSAEALDVARERAIDLVLLDIMMPKMDGYEVCQRLKADAATESIAVIFVSALDQVLDKVRAFKVGGVDYVTKPFNTREVLARVQTHLALQQLRHDLEQQNARLAAEIAERERVEAALRRASAEQFRAIFEQAAVGLSHSSLDGGFIRVNQRLCDIVGYTQAELRQMAFQDITHPDDLGADLELMQALLAGQRQSYSLEKRYCRKDGAVIWGKLTASLKRTEQGDPEYFIGVVEDISRRKAAEAELRQSQESYQMITELSRDMISLHDMEGRYLYASAASYELLGYAPEDLIGRGAYEIIHPEDQKQVRREQVRLLETAQVTASVTHRILRADGVYLWFETVARVVTIPGKESGRQILAVSRDVTERKEMEAQLQAYTEDLERMVQEKIRELELTRAKMIQTAKLASLGEMATGVAHALNQPLTAILFDADYLMRIAEKAQAGEIELPLEELALIGQELMEDVQRSRRITDYLRTFRQLTRSATSLVDVNAPLEDSFILTESRLSQHRILVVRDLTPDLPQVLANPHQLEQVFLNLISNAEYALTEMERRVRADQVARENYEKRLEVATYAEDAGVVIAVRDNGCGIPEDAREKIFEPYFSTRPQAEGAGLSLYISRNIVREFGGDICFETAENEGTTFYVRLPVS